MRGALVDHARRYPVERMREIERSSAEASARRGGGRGRAAAGPRYGVHAAVYRATPTRRAELLTELVDAGHDGTLVATARRRTRALRDPPRPYDDARGRRSAAGEAVRRRHGLSPRSSWSRRAKTADERRRLRASSERGARRAARDFGAILLRTHARSRAEQLEAARARAARDGRAARRLVVALGLLNEDEAARGARPPARPAGAPELRPDDVDPELVERVPIAFAKGTSLLPLGATEAARCASRSPTRSTPPPLDDLRLLFDGVEIETELASQREILGAIHEVYDRGAGSTDASSRTPPRTSSALASEISAEPQDLLESSRTRRRSSGWSNSLLQQAVKERASDIHIEPFENEHPRALPHRRHALRADRAAAEGAAAEHRLAHQDHGRPEHRREAPAAGRPHPAQDRRQRLRRAPLDRAGRLRRAHRDAPPAAHPGDARPRRARLRPAAARRSWRS